jgi:hypothetical protein
LLRAERDFIEKRVQKIIELKKVMCAGNNKGFVVVNQKVLIKKKSEPAGLNQIYF